MLHFWVDGYTNPKYSIDSLTTWEYINRQTSVIYSGNFIMHVIQYNSVNLNFTHSGGERCVEKRDCQAHCSSLKEYHCVEYSCMCGSFGP